MATSLPCLVFDYGDERPTKLYRVSDAAYQPCKIDLLLTKRNWVTARGWVLAWDQDTSATFLWDPQDPKSGQILLPSLPQAPPVGSNCVLSDDPVGKDGYTVVIAEPYGNSVLWYCHVGSPGAEWVRYEYDLGGSWVKLKLVGYSDFVKRHIYDLVSHSGKFYYSISANKCGVLEFSPEPTLSTVKTKGVKFPPDGEECAHGYAFLLDLDGELHSVWITFAHLDGNKIADVAVYKMGFGGSSCVRVNNIGDRAILASNNPAGWCSASKFKLRRNTVYWLSHFDKQLHMFDIKTNGKKVRECKGVVELSHLPFWLIPVHPP